MAELIIGRHARANGVTALRTIATGPKSKLFGSVVGGLGIVTVSFILSFYAIVSGWMLAFLPTADCGRRWFRGPVRLVDGGRYPAQFNFCYQLHATDYFYY